MNKRLTAAAVAGTIGLGAVGAVTLAYPALANTVAPTPSQSAAPTPGRSTPAQPAPAVPDQDFQQQREAALKEQLKSLVADGTLTQAQADKVAAKLAAAAPGPGFGHRGGPGRGFGGGFGGPFGGGFGVGMKTLEESAAKALGISADALRTQLRSGSTIADIAKKQNKSTDSVVTAIVQSARAQLAQAVKDKKLTQEQADSIDSNLKAGVQKFVEEGRFMMHLRGGPGGGPGKGALPAPPSGGPSAPATPSESGTSESSTYVLPSA